MQLLTGKLSRIGFNEFDVCVPTCNLTFTQLVGELNFLARSYKSKYNRRFQFAFCTSQAVLIKLCMFSSVTPLPCESFTFELVIEIFSKEKNISARI